MLPWQKREVYVGFSLDIFNQQREKLNASGIRYDYRVVDLQSGTFGRRGARGSYGINHQYTKQYYLYVDKKDYENAVYTLNSR